MALPLYLAGSVNSYLAKTKESYTKRAICKAALLSCVKERGVGSSAWFSFAFFQKACLQ